MLNFKANRSCMIGTDGADSFDDNSSAQMGVFNKILWLNFLDKVGNDAIGGSSQGVRLLGDTEDGYAIDDKIYGKEGEVVLRRQDGNDLLDGGAGNEALVDGNGNDVADQLFDTHGATTWRVVDTASGRDGADTLTDIEKLSFKDVSNVDLTIGSPLPVKDTLTTNSNGAAITRTGSHLISKLQLLANDKDWDSAVTDLRITATNDGHWEFAA